MLWDKLTKVKSKDTSVLSFITETLFPPLVRNVVDGAEFFVDYSIDSNLEAVIRDMQDGTVDEGTVDNLNYVIDRLHLVRKRYNLYPEMKTKSVTPVYYMVSANAQK